MRIEAKQLVNIIIGLIFLGVVAWVVFYYASRGPGPAPAPDKSPATYSEADRLKLLETLRSPAVKAVTPAQREQTLKTLRSSSAGKTITVAERERVLESLKAK